MCAAILDSLQLYAKRDMEPYQNEQIDKLLNHVFVLSPKESGAIEQGLLRFLMISTVPP